MHSVLHTFWCITEVNANESVTWLKFGICAELRSCDDLELTLIPFLNSIAAGPHQLSAWTPILTFLLGSQVVAVESADRWNISRRTVQNIKLPVSPKPPPSGLWNLTRYCSLGWGKSFLLGKREGWKGRKNGTWVQEKKKASFFLTTLHSLHTVQQRFKCC